MHRRRRLTLVSIPAMLAWVLFGGMARKWAMSSLDVREKTFASRPPSRETCTYDASHLSNIAQQFNIGDQFHYFAQTIIYQRQRGFQRQSMRVVPRALSSPETITVDIANQNHGGAIDGHCSEPLHIQVPLSGLPSTVDASDFIFGISTSFERLNDFRSEIINDWKYWLTDGHGFSNGAKLFLSLLEASDNELQEARTLLRDTGIDAIVDRSDSRDMPVRYINLVPYLYRQEDSRHRKWLVLCDDDTFSPSMHGLAQKLKAFDSSQELYIGALSEDAGAIERHGSQAFGGAGIFLSFPMAKVITDSISSCASEKKVKEAGWQGDQLLRNCIYAHSDTRLLPLPDLWQLDFRGDAAGFYESGRKPLSLHHYRGDGWHKARPAEFSKIAYSCGEDCILQWFQTADNFIISGHSIAYYPEGITFDTSQVERTFEPLWERGCNFDFVFGPQRPSLKDSGKKISWEIQKSEVGSDGSIQQIYFRKKDHFRWNGAGNRRMGDLDSVIELIWVPSDIDA